MDPSPPSEEPTMDWRTQIPSDLREKTFNKIFETLREYLAFSGIETVKKCATKFEEDIFYLAANQDEYLRLTTLRPPAESQNADASSSSNNTPPLDLDNSKPNEEPAANTYDWRAELPDDFRLKNIETIVDYLKEDRSPNPRQEVIDELMTTAINWEQINFYRAINEEDYYERIADTIVKASCAAKSAKSKTSESI